MPNHTRPTLRDVAREAGLSVTQTSRALNGHDDVAVQARERAVAAAAALGYVPNLQARRLKVPDSRAHSLGIVLSPSVRFSDPFLGELLTVMVGEASQQGYELQLSAPPPEEDPIASYQRFIRQQRVDGFVLLRLLLDDERVTFLMRHSFPFVAFGRLPHRAGFPAVDEGDHSVRPAVDHLVSLGHRRIGCLAEPQRQAKGSYRLQSFLAAAKAHGLSIDPGHIVEAGYREDTGHAAALQLLDRPDRPTALVALNDLLAIGAMRAADELGLDVPSALSVVGFDDIDASQRVAPALTTLRQPTGEIGRLLIRELLVAVDRSGPPVTRLVEPTLVVRASTAPPPRA